MQRERPVFAVTCLAALLAATCICGGTSCAPPEEMRYDAGIEDGPRVLAIDPAIDTQNAPLNQVIRATFSDHLDTRTFDQNKFRLYSGPLSLWIDFYYNPVHKQLVVWPNRNMRRNMLWILRLEEGIYDIEGNPTAPQVVARFRTGDNGATQIPYTSPSFEREILPIFQGKCASCHGGETGSELAGIRLDSAASINETLIHQPASGWPDWYIIKPSDPGRSFLLYKLMGDPRIPGLPMPRTKDLNTQDTPLPIVEQDAIANWIASGAPFFDQ